MASFPPVNGLKQNSRACLDEPLFNIFKISPDAQPPFPRGQYQNHNPDKKGN